MITVSLAMIVKNEEDTIGRCLDSVKDLVDEIIIVDTGSSDQTKEIASKYTNMIYDFEWIDDFAAARNFSFAQATKEYIFWLDADDVLLEEDRKKFLTLKSQLDQQVDSVSMHYNLELDDYGNVLSSLRRNRLVKRENNFKWIGAVHEYLEVGGNIINSDISITHFSIRHDADRNLRIYEKLRERKKEFSPRDLFYYANELFDHQMYPQAIKYYKQFLSTKKGWVEDYISACANLSDCYHQLGDKENEVMYVLRSFEYDTPRADFCCRLGYFFLKNNSPFQAIFWYKLAISLEKPVDWGRVNHACWTWLPHLMLYTCYSQLGEWELAFNHNEEAARYLPDHPSIVKNRQYLEAVRRRNQLIENEEKWQLVADKVDKHFLQTNGEDRLNLTFIMDHANLCGGVKMILEYANYLIKCGHHVNIVCRDPKPDWMQIDASYIQVPEDEYFVNAIPETDIIITTYYRQMVDCFLAEKAPVIHFEQGDTYIFEFETYDQTRQDEIRQYWSVPIPIIAVSGCLAKHIDNHFHRKPRILPYALNDKVFFSRDELGRSYPPQIMFVGPEQWHFKGISDIIKSINIVREKGYKIEPVWVTQIPPDSVFEGNIYIRPALDELGELYRSADIFICGSHYESFGLPPLEAMTCGCAVVSTRNVGVMEYAEHEINSLLVNIGDPVDLANTITELLDDEEKRIRLVKGGYETAKRYNIERVIVNMERYLYGAIKISNDLSRDKILDINSH